jgi:hypothetical protein
MNFSSNVTVPCRCENWMLCCGTRPTFVALTTTPTTLDLITILLVVASYVSLNDDEVPICRLATTSEKGSRRHCHLFCQHNG